MSEHIDFNLPSPETLAGIYVCIEGHEDLTVRPRQIQPISIDTQRTNGAPERDSPPTSEPKPTK